MKHRNNHYNNKIIKKLVKDGFTCESPGKNGNKFMIYKDDGPKYIVHSGDAKIHLKLFLRQNYEYEI
tara:strand:- start:337 stop:537 length:201 start_codon:yes stop_codon:yes gene_type:complete